MVRQGWALAYRKYSTAYVTDEEAARANGAGIWRGDFVPPWHWRRSQRLSGGSRATDSDKDCGDFTSCAEAQAIYERAGPGDPHRLDGDRDGIACEGLRR